MRIELLIFGALHFRNALAAFLNEDVAFPAFGFAAAFADDLFARRQNRVEQAGAWLRVDRLSRG